MKTLFLLVIFCLLFSVNIFNQEKEITRQEYYKAFREASVKGNTIPQRSLAQRENYKEGKLDSTEEYIDEYLTPDKRRYVHSEKFSDRARRIELIQIGKTYFCKRDNEDWKQSASGCDSGSGFGVSKIVSEEFTIETIKLQGEKVKVYKNLTSYKNNSSPNKDKEGLSYYQNKFWINKDGLIIKLDAINGPIEPKMIYWQTTNAYEYNPKDLKIEAPIK
jgi:hypothetical protein